MDKHTGFPFGGDIRSVRIEEILGGDDAAARREPAETWTLRVRGRAPKRLSDGCVKAMPFTLYDDPRIGCDAASRLLALSADRKRAA